MDRSKKLPENDPAQSAFGAKQPCPDCQQTAPSEGRGSAIARLPSGFIRQGDQLRELLKCFQ